MGLAGRKSKQRIGPDPRNVGWADDASRFGQKYLEKLGWSSGSGLGAEGDGMTTHIKVMKKLDLMGIGAGRKHADDEGGQGREYERLLKRLNEAAATKEQDDEALGTGRDEGEILKEPDAEKKKKKKRKAAEIEVDEQPVPPPAEELPAAPVSVESRVYVPRPMAHRAKFLKSKKMASASNASINEILGISSATASAMSSSVSTPLSISLTSTPVPTVPPSESLSQSSSAAPSPAPIPESDAPLSTSTKSVADYFAEKLAARKKAFASVASGPAKSPLSTPLGVATAPGDDRPSLPETVEPVDSEAASTGVEQAVADDATDLKEEEGSSKKKKDKKDKSKQERKEKKKRDKSMDVPVEDTEAVDEERSSKSKKKRRKEKD